MRPSPLDAAAEVSFLQGFLSLSGYRVILVIHERPQFPTSGMTIFMTPLLCPSIPISYVRTSAVSSNTHAS